MGMMIEELITFCEEEEQNHRVKAKRADDASGYTRSRDKNIRTSNAIREEVYGDFYKQIAETMRKYQRIEQMVNGNINGAYSNIAEIRRIINGDNSTDGKKLC